MVEFGIESESESESSLSVGPIHPKLWEHWAWAGLGLGLLLLCFLLRPPGSMGSCSMFRVALNGPSLPLLCSSFLLLDTYLCTCEWITVRFYFTYALTILPCS